MSVFISYSHKDEVFARRLGKELLANNVKVWMDSWGIGVGASIMHTVQDEIKGTRFGCVVLSKNFVESEFCKREIAALFHRELKEKQVIILPVLIDDCEIPSLFVDKRYVDFRSGFEKGFAELLGAVLPYYRVEGCGKISRDDKYFIHYKAGTGKVEGKAAIDLTAISFDLEESYSMLTQLRFVHVGIAEMALDTPVEKNQQIERVLDACNKAINGPAGVVSVLPGRAVETSFTLFDQDGHPLFNAFVSITTVGEIRSGAVQFDFGAILSQIANATRNK